MLGVLHRVSAISWSNPRRTPWFSSRSNVSYIKAGTPFIRAGLRVQIDIVDIIHSDNLIATTRSNRRSSCQ